MASQVSTIVSTKWLSDQITQGASNLRILDTSWYSKGDRNAFNEYKERHIPGAMFYDMMANTDHTSPYPHTLPSPEAFSKFIGKLGVGADTHVVIYDGSEYAGFFPAPRLWWMLRLFGSQKVSILSGGLLKWIADGYKVTDVIPKIEEVKFEAKFHAERLKTFEEMLSNTKEQKYQVMDARPKAMFDGGHIPNSINIPFYEIINVEDKTFRSSEELKKIFEDKGINLSKPLTSLCGSGVAACVPLLGAHLAGKDDTCLFDGAWSEYSSRAKPEDIQKI